VLCPNFFRIITFSERVDFGRKEGHFVELMIDHVETKKQHILKFEEVSKC